MIYICNFVATFRITWLCYGAKLIDLSIQRGGHCNWCPSWAPLPQQPCFCHHVNLINLSSKNTYFSKIPSCACLHCRQLPDALLPFGLTCSLTSLIDEAEWACVRWKLLGALFHSCQAPCDIQGRILFFQHEYKDQLVIGPVQLSQRTELLWSCFHGCRCIQPAAPGPASQHVVSLSTIFTKIEISDRIYNIEFKIWGG